MLFFSDAVFAIAITLLIIEVHVPEIAAGSAPGTYLHALLELWSAFFGFMLSFLVIARFWITHHTAFAHSPPFDAKLLWPNVWLLMSIAFMPFATAFMFRNLGAMVPALVYFLVLMVASLLSVRMVRMATSLGDAEALHGAEGLAMLRTRGLSIFFAAGLAFLLGFLIPQLSPAALATAPLWLYLMKRRTLARKG
jgi:uncharacterized membrane protein